jgi:hypothetical protein
MAGLRFSALLIFGMALTGCGNERSMSQTQLSSENSDEQLAANDASKKQELAKKLDGVLVCNGTLESVHHGYPAEKVDTDKSEIGIQYSRGQNTPVHIWNRDTKAFDEACSYDCQTMGSREDWSLRSGHRLKREATTAMGSTTHIRDMEYKNGHLSVFEEAQAMTPMGPTMDTMTIEANCKPITV